VQLTNHIKLYHHDGFCGFQTLEKQLIIGEKVNIELHGFSASIACEFRSNIRRAFAEGAPYIIMRETVVTIVSDDTENWATAKQPFIRVHSCDASYFELVLPLLRTGKYIKECRGIKMECCLLHKCLEL
jgi:hypothetical protein